MSESNDQALARWMLDARGVDMTFAAYVRRRRKQYAIFVVVGAAGLAALAAMQTWTVFALVGGMLVGAVLRDVGWLRSYRAARPFREKVTDWAKVQRIADGETAA